MAEEDCIFYNQTFKYDKISKDNLVSSGVVGCHDYKGDLPQTTRAIENLIEKHKNEIKEIVEIPSKWVVLLVKK